METKREDYCTGCCKTVRFIYRKHSTDPEDPTADKVCTECGGYIGEVN